MFSSTVRNAIVAWVRTATGLASGKVILADQDGRRPDGTFIALRFGTVLTLGAVDANYAVYDAGGDPGEEIVETVRGEREFTVDLQAFAQVTPGGADDGRALLGACQTALGLPSVRSALAAAGVSIFDKGTVQTVPAVAGAEFEARSVLTVRGYGRVTASSTTGLIETVEVEDVDGGNTYVVG